MRKRLTVENKILLLVGVSVASIIVFCSLCFAKWLSTDTALKLKLLVALPVEGFKFIYTRAIERQYVPTPVPFDKEKWRQAKDSEGDLTIRFCMLGSLTKSHKLVGTTKQELIALLDKPSKDYIIGRGREYLIYDIGRIHDYRKSLSISLMDETAERFDINSVEEAGD